MASPYAVDPQPFASKVIAVTGASRGVGLALCKYLLARGATVSGCATSAENLANAVEEIEREFPEAKGRYWTCVADISKLDNVKAWIEQTVARFGNLDGCANVAGMVQRDIFPITDLDPGTFVKLLNVNVVGTSNCLKEEMKVIKDGGSIVNVGSVASSYASAGAAGYISSKHALIGLTKVAAFEGAPRRVRVNALCPGLINTDMMAGAYHSPAGEFYLSAQTMPRILKRNMAEPWEIAASIAFLLGDESSYVTKATWFHDGGWTEGSVPWM